MRKPGTDGDVAGRWFYIDAARAWVFDKFTGCGIAP